MPKYLPCTLLAAALISLLLFATVPLSGALCTQRKDCIELVEIPCFAGDLAAVEVAVMTGEWKRAQRLAKRLDRRVIDKAAAGSECVRPTLARLAALRAIALASSGDLEPALWLWLGAEALDAEQLPDLADFPTSAALGVQREPMPMLRPASLEVTREEHRRRSTPPRLFTALMGRRIKGSASVTGDLTAAGLPAAVRIDSASARIAYVVLDLCSVVRRPEGVPRFSCNQSF